MQAVADIETIRWMMPELILLLAAVYLFVMGMTLGNRAWWATFTLGALMISGITLMRQQTAFWHTVGVGPSGWSEGPLWIDFLGELVRLLAWITGCLLVLMSYRAAPRRLAPEYLGALLLAVLGAMVVARANDLVLLFLGLELISIPSYVVLSLGRADRAGMEATAKYFFLSVLSSAVMLYGFSFLFGLAGTTQIVASVGNGGVSAVVGSSSSILATIGLVLVAAGIGYKLAAVPFHFYAPDVYQGTSFANAGFLATVPKLAAVVVLIRLLGYPAASASPFAWELLVVLSMATIILGNTCALWQSDIRRLMAYSSIGHAGYMLAGLAVFLAMGSDRGFGGISAMVFYAAVYIPATMGIFAVGAALGPDGREVSRLADISGLARRRPVIAAMASLFLFSLAGIPPLAGFWGKLGVLASVIDGGVRWAMGSDVDPRGAWLFALAIVAGVNAAIGAAFYLRVVAAMYFGDSGRKADTKQDEGKAWPVASLGPLASATVSAWLVVVLGLMPGPLYRAGFEVERALATHGDPTHQDVLVDRRSPSDFGERPARRVSVEDVGQD